MDLQPNQKNVQSARLIGSLSPRPTAPWIPVNYWRFSRLYRADEWFRASSFEQLVFTPTHTLTLEGIRSIGERNYTALSQLPIYYSPSSFVNFGYSLHLSSITLRLAKSSRSCESAWRLFWWNDFAKGLLGKDPSSELSGSGVSGQCSSSGCESWTAKIQWLQGYNGKKEVFLCGTHG